MIVSTKFEPLISSYSYKRNQKFHFHESLEQYCNVLPVFVFYSAKPDLNSFKSLSQPNLVNIQEIDTFIRRANWFICFGFSDNQLLEVLSFCLSNSFWFLIENVENLRNHKKLSRTNSWIIFTRCKLHNVSHLRTDTVTSCKGTRKGVNFLNNCKTTGPALIKLKKSQPPPTGVKNS